MEEPSTNQSDNNNEEMEQTTSEQHPSTSQNPQLQDEKLQKNSTEFPGSPESTEDGLRNSDDNLQSNIVTDEFVKETCDKNGCLKNKENLDFLPEPDTHNIEGSMEMCRCDADIEEPMFGVTRLELGTVTKDENQAQESLVCGTGDITCLCPSQKRYVSDSNLQGEDTLCDNKSECDSIKSNNDTLNEKHHNFKEKKDSINDNFKEKKDSIDDTSLCQSSFELQVLDSPSDANSDQDVSSNDCLIPTTTAPSRPLIIPLASLESLDQNRDGESQQQEMLSEEPSGGTMHNIHVDIINGPTTVTTSLPSQLQNSSNLDVTKGEGSCAKSEDEASLTGDQLIPDNIILESPTLESPSGSEDFDLIDPDLVPQRPPSELDEDQELAPLYEVGPITTAECKICLEEKRLSLRPCCKAPICDTCMTTYLEGVIREGKVKIFCPGYCPEAYIPREEIVGRISPEMKDKYAKFLINANNEPHIKTCPRCSNVLQVDLAEIRNPAVKKKGYLVTCTLCQLRWCFPCQSPWHEGITCKDFRKGDKLLKKWAKEKFMGQFNAQKCPKCQVFIQRISGCDHMTCSKCNAWFCYRCGERYRHLKYIGDHYSRFSILGCKYIYKPDNDAQRRLIRGSIFGAKLMAAPLLGVLAIGAGAVLLGGGIIFFLPCYGIKKLLKHRQEERRRRQRAEERARWNAYIKTIRAAGDPYIEHFNHMQGLGISPYRLAEAAEATANVRGPGYISEEMYELAGLALRTNITLRRGALFTL